MKTDQVIAIIPARGGSKRIPKKNIREFMGKPALAYPIQAAHQSGLFDRIIVSTDSPEIAEIAQSNGAEVPFLRPKLLADDYSGTDSVIIHALEWFAASDISISTFCCLYPLSTLITAEQLKLGYSILQESQAAIAFSAISTAQPVFRALKERTDGRFEMIWPEHRVTRTQDLPETYFDAGQFYWGDYCQYMQAPQLLGTNSIAVVLPDWAVQDIDSPDQWEMAEIKYRMLQEMGKL